jgi:hypothetical protein
MNARLFIRVRHFPLLLLLMVVSLACAGCGSTEPDNESVKPWNTPEGWQGGSLQMMQPH